jgi:hypothetical protein
MEFNAMEKHSDEEYSVYIGWLEKRTADDLKRAKGHEHAIRAAIQHYLDTGYGAYLSPGELVDFFCVSTPSILHLAEYSEEETDAAVKLYDEINYETFPRFYPINQRTSA